MGIDGKYAVCGLLWVAWCFLHSATISITMTDFIKRKAGNAFRFYRMFFNLFAAATLIPVIHYSSLIKGRPIFAWEGNLIVIHYILLAIVFALLGGSLLKYDLLQFIGIRQALKQTPHNAMSESGELDTTGILGIVRHPLYLMTIIALWSGNLDTKGIMVNTILTIYVLTGTILEERKLIHEFGDKYRAYQKRVPMLIPYKLMKRK
ncbi:MAG: isoprenylcysteine carboxylmethyltransferase family protein [bacterium]